MFDPLSQPLRGTHSIEASAGTGKTFSITLLWLRLLVEEQLGVEQILVSTFTRAATAELKERLLSSLRKATTAAEAAMRGLALPQNPEAAILANALQNGASDAASLLERLSAALSSFDLAPISTIHGFCQTLISRHALELGCDPALRLVETQHRFLEDLVTDTVLHFSASPHPRITRLPDDLRKIAAPVAARPGAEVKTDSGSPQERLEQRIREDLPRLKTLAGVRTFDDILHIVRDALHKQGPGGPLACAVRQRLRAAIIDECQDSDMTQIRVFQTLFDHQQTCSFLVIGDPKQSIYRFRGADLASYKDLAGRAKQAPPMGVNYRSDAPLIAALNFLYGDNFVFPDSRNAQDPASATRYTRVSADHGGVRVDDPDLRGTLVFHKTGKTRREPAKRALAAWIGAECARLLASGTTVVDRTTKHTRTLAPGDIAVLAATKRDLRMVRRALLAEGIPSQLDGKGLGSVYTSAEALDLLAWLELLATFSESGDTLGRLCTFLATPLGGFPCGDIPGLREDPVHIAALCTQYRQLAALLGRSGPLPALMHHLASPPAHPRESAPGDGAARVLDSGWFGRERRVTNWRHLGSLLQSRFANGLRTAASLGEWLAVQMGAKSPDTEEGEGESALMKLETDDSAVQLLTIHASKGLEYPVVFCPFLWDIRSPASTKSKMKVAILRTSEGWLLNALDPIPAQIKTQAVEQEQEEEHRKLYVALTRPRHRLYLGLADIPDGGRGHTNGSQRSSLFQLPNLQAALQNARKPGAQDDNTTAHACLPPLDAVLLENDELVVSSGARSQSAASPAGAEDPLVPAPGGSESFARHPLFTRRSFSSLCRAGRGAEHHLHEPDRDDTSQNPDPAPAPAQDLLADLGRAGAELGDRLHRALENYLGNNVALPTAVTAYPDPEKWTAALSTIVSAELAFDDHRMRLHDIRGSCITEMQFHMPTARFSREALSRALLEDGRIRSCPLHTEWAEQFASWPITEFSGFFQGFIDLIFEHEGRWYVMDYKSNRLRGYETAEIQSAMLQHHYLLQARIYAVALHRHLQHHLPDYSFEKHFGGVAYVFVRALPQGGVWFERCDRHALESLAALFPTPQA